MESPLNPSESKLKTVKALSERLVATACNTYIAMAAIAIIIMEYGHGNLNTLTDLSIFQRDPIWKTPLATGVLTGVVLISFTKIFEFWINTQILFDSLSQQNTSIPQDTKQKTENEPCIPEKNDRKTNAAGPTVSFRDHWSDVSTYIQVAFVTVCASFAEELVFRAALQPFCGLFIGSILYALFHGGFSRIFSTSNGLAFFKGLFLGWVFMQTGSIWIGVLGQLIHKSYTLLSIKRSLSQAKARHH